MRKGAAGGKARAAVQKREAVHRYWLNPSYCKECGNVLMPTRMTQPIRELRSKSFCNQSCAAFFNNRLRIPKTKSKFIPKEKVLKSKPPKAYIVALTKTKGEIFDAYPTWQASRSVIQKSARYIYFWINDKGCKICGYSHHTEVSHIRAVKDFPPEAYLYDINHIKNLVGLCPNHHWEFDNGLLNIPTCFATAGSG
jgi:hypothetical protein